jgi:hypothetical protein
MAITDISLGARHSPSDKGIAKTTAETTRVSGSTKPLYLSFRAEQGNSEHTFAKEFP